MSSLLARGRRLYAKIHGKRIATPYFVGDERKAKAWGDEVEDRLDAGTALAPEGGPVTVRLWARKWIENREKANVEDVRNNRAHLRDYILPAFGDVEVASVRPRQIRALILELKASDLAPRTVRNVYGTIRALFRDATMEDLVSQSPAILREPDLPPVEDADPEWRARAKFSRDELATLIFDDRLPQDRRTFYALLGLAFLRHGEAAGLLWRDLEEDEPLAGLLVTRSYDRPWTKTRRVRRVPVIPALAKILAEWRLAGWERMMGRAPTPDDLVVPQGPRGRWEKARVAAGGMRSKRSSWRRLDRDLADLGFRARRVHDFRRTAITLARADGANKDVLRRATHGSSGDVIELYTSPEWVELCREVSKFTVRKVARGKVVALAAPPSLAAKKGAR